MAADESAETPIIQFGAEGEPTRIRTADGTFVEVHPDVATWIRRANTAFVLFHDVARTVDRARKGDYAF